MSIPHRFKLGLLVPAAAAAAPENKIIVVAPSMASSRRRLSKDVEYVLSPAQTSGRGTPRLRRPAHLIPPAAKLQYGDEFLITTVDGQHCLCPNMFDSSMFLIPIRFVKEAGFFPLCVFTFERLERIHGGSFPDHHSSSNSFRDGDPTASRDSSSPFVYAGDDLSIRHRISSRYIQFDDCNSPIQEPAYSCANMTYKLCDRTKMRLQYRVSVDAEARCLLSRTEISIAAHTNEQSYLCPANRAAQDFCTEVMFANDRQCGWLIEPVSATDAQTTASINSDVHGMRCGCLGRIRSVHGLTLSYHPTALFPVFIPLDSVTSDGSWTDPESVWSLWMFEDADNCFNVSSSSSSGSVHLRHAVTARLLRVGGACKHSSSDPESTETFINTIGVAENRGSQFSVHVIDQNRFMLSCGDAARPLVIQSTQTELAVLNFLPSGDDLFRSANTPISLSTAAPGCSSLNILTACPFRSENSVILWHPASDRIQHQIYCMSPLLISTANARAELLSQMGATHLASIPPPESAALNPFEAVAEHELERSLRDSVQVVKNMGDFFSQNMTFIGDKVMSVGAPSANVFAATNTADAGRSTIPHSLQHGGSTEAECLDSLCQLASSLLDPLTEVIRDTLAVLQSQGVNAMKIMQSLDILPVLGEIAFLFSSYLVHMLSSVRKGHQDDAQSLKPLLNKCVFVGSVVSGPMPSFYQHVVAFRSCIKSHYHGPTAQQVLSDMQGGIGSNECWRGLESLLYLSPSFRTFTTCVSEMVRLCAHALTAYECDANLFTCIVTAVPYYIHCDQTLMGLLKHNLIRVKYGESVLDIAFQRLISFFKKNCFFSESHLLRRLVSKSSAQHEFWISEGSFWINVINFFAEQRDLEGLAFRRQIFSLILQSTRQGGALPAFKSTNGGSALLVCRPSVSLHNSLDAQNIQPQNATARWVTSGGLLSVGRGNDVEPGWTDLMSCDVQKTPSLSITGNSIPPHEVVALVSATMLLYHNLVFHEDLKKCTPHVWSDLLQFVCRQCPSEFVLGCLSNPLFSYDIRRAACKLTTRLAFQCVRRQFSMPILSWGSEKIIPVLDVECNRTTFFKWIDDYKSLTSILMNLLECFKPEEDSRRPPPALAIAILELACEAIANNLWTDLPSIKQFYSIFSGIFLHALSPDQNRERALNLSIINEYLPFLQGHYIKAIRDGFNFVSVEPGETVCSGRGLASDPCVIICQFGELSMCYDDLGNGAVCISTVSTGETVGLEILNLVATNWFDEAGLSSAPIAQKKCIATRRSQLWVITRSALMSAVLARSHAIDLFNPVSNVEIDVRCRAASAMSLCLELEQKVFCLQAVRQMRLHINLAPGIYIQPCRPFKQQRPSESLSVVLGDASASIVENLFRASGGHLLINDTRIMGYRINRAACAVFLIHAIVSLGLTTLKILNRLGNAQDASVGKNDNMSHEFLAVMFILWFFCSLFGLYSVSSRKPRLIQWALVGHSISVITAIFGLIVSSYTELEQLSYVTILSKLSAALLAIFFEGYLFLIVLTYFALLSKKEAYRASVELSLKNQEIVDNLLLDHFSRNQLFASSANVIFSQIASNESRLSETASNFFLSNCQNKAKLFAALESCVLLRTPHSEMVFQALIAACNDLYKNALELIETILSLSHPPSFQEKRRLWPPILLDTSMLSQSGRLISILVDLKIKVSVIYNTLRKEAAKYDGKSGVMSPSEWRRVAYASQLDNSLCIIVGVAQSICTYVTGFESLHFNSEQGNQLVSACLELLAWCCVEDVRWQEIVAELMHEVGPTIVFICPTQAAAAIAECSRNNTKVRVMHGKKMVHLLCAPFDPKNIKFMKNNHIEALLHALRILIAGSVVSATLPVENLGEYVIAHVLPFASKILEQLGSVKCRFIACDDSDVQDHVEISSDIVSDRQLVPCGRCEGTGMQKGFKCCFCDGKRYVSVSLAQAPSNVFFDEHGLSIAPMAADATSKVQVYGSRPSKGPEWWTRFGEKCCQETLYLLAVTCELGNHYISSQIRGVISFDCAGKAACDPSASTELRAALVRFCASVHIPAATVNNIDRRWANPVHPAWLITDAMSRYVQDNPVSRLDDVSHDINSPAYVLLSVWTPVIESVCKRVLAHNTRAMCKPIMEILRRFADSICISGCSSTNITFCQNAVSCLSVLRALDLRAQVNLFETFDNYVAQEVFAQNALVSLSKTSDLSASTSDISALRWKSYISAIKPPAEHIEIAIADQLIQAEPGIHLAKSVASTIAFNLCSSCRKGGQLFDQHDTWSDVVRGITQSIEPCASKIPKNSLFSVKWISEGVCNIIIDSISMAATYSRHRFAHSSGGLYLGIRFLHSFKLQGQELLLQAILNRGDDNFFAGLIAIIDEAAVTAPRVSTFYSQIVQTLKREQLSRDAMLTQVSTDDHVHSARKPVSIEESKVWERLDQLVTESTGCTLSQRLAFGGLAAKFVQCWCEDHNAAVQDAFAGQRPHGSSNPIISLSNLVLVCSRQACAPLQFITSLAIEAITESIQRPCKLQQIAVAQTDIVHACDDLVLGRWSDGSDAEIVFFCNCPLPIPETLRSVLHTGYSLPDIRSKACGLFLALVESLDAVSLTSEAIDSSTPVLILKAMRFEEHKKALSQMNPASDQDLTTCANIVVVLLTLQPYIPKFGAWAAKAVCIQSILSPQSNDDIPIMARVRKHIRCVDIVRNGVINRVWFPQPDVMEFCREHYLEFIQRSIFNPSDRDAQLGAFCLLSLALIEHMLLDQSLSRNILTRSFTRVMGWVQHLFYINAILINAIMLFAFEHPDQETESSVRSAIFFNLSPDIIFRNTEYMYTLRVLSAIQLFFSALMFIWFMIFDVSFIVRERIRQNAAWIKVFVNQRGGPQHFVIWCRSVGSNPRFLALSSYLITSILAVAAPDKYTPMLFLCLHLAEAIHLSKDMKVVLNFISSVWMNLVTVIAFIFILLNIFGAVGFVWIPDWFELPETNSDWYPAVNGSITSGAAVEAPCSTLWRCFLIQVDKGLVLGDIDFGIVATTTADLPDLMIYSRIFYSFLFQVIIGILCSFILYTVVIDSFSKASSLPFLFFQLLFLQF